uniref:Chemokine interleukin-8-like domain-containing protein n=1 Tax=Oreochromis aureus TaxID=47969 RepID=A0A668T2Q5_OREAU
MVKSGSLFALVAVVLLAVTVSGSVEKLATCCKIVTNKEITEPILGYLVQRANGPCVNAVIFQTQSGLFCINGRAPGFVPRLLHSSNPSVTNLYLPSLHHNIHSPSSSSTALPSSSATSEMSAGETFSESRNRVGRHVMEKEPGTNLKISNNY